MHVFPYTTQCAGNGNVAVAARVAMGDIAEQAAEQLGARTDGKAMSNSIVHVMMG